MKLLVNRAMKRVLALFLTVVAVLGLFGMQTPISKVSAAGETYKKVTAQEEVVAGGQYLIVCPSKNTVMGAQNTTYRDSLSVKIENDIITALPEGAQVVTLEKNGDNFNLKVGDSKYLYSSTAKKLTTNASGYAWEITVNNDGATITASTIANNNLQYNANNPRFLCYTSKQTAIALFKLEGDTTEGGESGGGTTEPTCEHANTTTDKKEASCTENGYEKITCNDCGDTVKDEIILATGHTYVNGICSVCKQEGTVYKKVISVDELKDGAKVIIGAPGNGAVMGAQSGNYRSVVKVDTTGNDFVAPEGSQVATIEETESGYYLKVADGYLNWESGNSLTTGAEPYEWTIDIVDGVTTIEHVVDENETRKMKYNYNNGSNSRFACYSSNFGDPIVIYKKQLTASEQATVSGFENLQTQSTFKLNYNGNTLDESKVQLRFFASMDEALYTKLTDLNAKFGVEATMNGQTIRGYCANVAQADGEVKFAGLVTIAKGVWDQTVTAKAFVEIGGTKYYMRATDEHSVNSLAAYWLGEGYADNAVIQYLAGQAE